MTGYSSKWRKPVSVVLAAPLLVVAAMLYFAPSASAGSAAITARADCRGTVTFTVASWTNSKDGANSKVGVYYSLDGSSYTPVTSDKGDTIKSDSGVLYAFNSENGY